MGSSTVGPDPRIGANAGNVEALEEERLATEQQAHGAAHPVDGHSVGHTSTAAHIAEGASIVAHEVHAASALHHAAELTERVIAAGDGTAKTGEAGAALLDSKHLQSAVKKLTGSEHHIEHLERAAGRAEKIAGVADKFATVGLGVVAGLTSENQTTTAKVAEGVMVSGGMQLMGVAVGATPVGRGLMTADLALNYFGEKISPEFAKKAGGGLMGNFVLTPAKMYSAWGEAISTGDHTAIDKFADDMKSGKLGVVQQKYYQAGEYLSDKLNLVDGIEATVKFADKTGVSKALGKAATGVGKGIDAVAVAGQKTADALHLADGIEKAVAFDKKYQVTQKAAKAVDVATDTVAKAHAAAVDATSNGIEKAVGAWNKTMSFFSGR